MRQPRIDLYEIIKPELLAGEEILWVGQGDQSKLLAREDLFLIPFSILWCSLAVMWTVLASTGGGYFWLAGLPFLALGIYFTVGRFFVKNEQKKRTIYAITDRRVLVLKLGRDDQVKHLTALELNRISQETSRIDSRGRATIVFGRIPFRQSFYYNIGFPWANSQLPKFVDVLEGRKVLRIYQTAKGKLKETVGIPGFK